MPPTVLDCPPSAPSSKSLAGKYLSFFLNGGVFGIPVLKIREIISMLPVTQMPQMPAYVKGVINLRGKVIPIVNLRTRLSLPEVEATPSTCIVIAQFCGAAGQNRFIGLIVDAVDEVSTISETEIEPRPDFGGCSGGEYILGMAKIKGTVKCLLAIDQILAGDTLAVLTAEPNPSPSK